MDKLPTSTGERRNSTTNSTSLLIPWVLPAREPMEWYGAPAGWTREYSQNRPLISEVGNFFKDFLSMFCLHLDLLYRFYLYCIVHFCSCWFVKSDFKIIRILFRINLVRKAWERWKLITVLVGEHSHHCFVYTVWMELPKTNSKHSKNGWVEDHEISWNGGLFGLFSGAFAVSFREGSFLYRLTNTQASRRLLLNIVKMNNS